MCMAVCARRMGEVVCARRMGAVQWTRTAVCNVLATSANGIGYVHPDPCQWRNNYVSPSKCWLRDTSISANELSLCQPYVKNISERCVNHDCAVLAWLSENSGKFCNIIQNLSINWSPDVENALNILESISHIIWIYLTFNWRVSKRILAIWKLTKKYTSIFIHILDVSEYHWSKLNYIWSTTEGFSTI